MGMERKSNSCSSRAVLESYEIVIDIHSMGMERKQTQVPLIERRGNQGYPIILLHVRLQQHSHEAPGFTMARPNLETTISQVSSNSKPEEREGLWKKDGLSGIDLELQEVKGFTELGFHFGKEELSPRIMDVVPGLKHLIIRREQPLPSPKDEEGEDMKQRLRLWARCVASTLK